MARTSTDEGGSFTAEERAAMKERAREVRSQRKNAKADPEPEVLAKIAELPEADRLLAERVHALVREAAPHLVPRLWYGMPAYARDGKLVVFFQAAAKFKARYATLGFDQGAALDDGAMWPTAYALTELTPEVEDRIRTLVARAAG
ncbi:hypothetical protein CHO01_08650 [Cellulomonas hominis]|uniref:Uncharacterized protein YdhG (YjbR/CyaY superfamily) n=1 Tax=Cellulomonas hominis TaxID=156981 RepID=A0A511F8Z6_9CELL|nr:DUF1801 domain-containing protein [Cellulomonas hominis]MBB5471907.1 uncharacterized protein YdhG (YjbR/CyaY superfamily) [Cellulomonas hominis]NKY07267.1 DUF1801 domain-containing protein [Cellulomonas hominis]NKY08920.1 DUF1801 domain-containing protein [Cellulomonas hominis]GEL45749.1 hypothetical protein CHO01_08650 [Cellulomonas hominis]